MPNPEGMLPVHPLFQTKSAETQLVHGALMVHERSPANKMLKCAYKPNKNPDKHAIGARDSLLLTSEEM